MRGALYIHYGVYRTVTIPITIQCRTSQRPLNFDKSIYFILKILLSMNEIVFHIKQAFIQFYTNTIIN